MHSVSIRQDQPESSPGAGASCGWNSRAMGKRSVWNHVGGSHPPHNSRKTCGAGPCGTSCRFTITIPALLDVVYPIRYHAFRWVDR